MAPNHYSVSVGNVRYYVLSEDVSESTFGRVLADTGNVVSSGGQRSNYEYRNISEKEYEDVLKEAEDHPRYGSGKLQEVVDSLENAKKGVGAAKDIADMGDHMVTIAKIDPQSPMNNSTAIRWLRKCKLRAVASVLSVVLDGINLTLSVIEDGGKFGRSTTITLAEIGGTFVGAQIGASLGSIFPGLGTIIGGFLGGLIGGLITGGIFRFFLGHSLTAPGPGAPVLETDPYNTAFGPPKLQTQPHDRSGRSDPTPSGAVGVPGLQFKAKTGQPKMFFNTR